MKFPKTDRKKALIIVDVQPAFIRPANEYVVALIAGIIAKVPYDFFVFCLFQMEPGSLWETQQNWTMPQDSKIAVPPKIANALEGRPFLTIHKNTRSAFKGTPDLHAALQAHDIQEVHVAGFATHDCVLATAFDAFDHGYPVYVLEEASDATDHPERHQLGLAILRNQNMTNHSCLAPTTDISIS